MGYADTGCYGAPDARTPNIDRLARQGVRFANYYANGQECTPTRTALVTGRYQQRVGGMECAIGTHNVGRYDDAIRLADRHDLGLPVEQAVLPGALKQAGYAAAIVGKWHLGYEEKFNPVRYGWDSFFGILGGNADYFRHTEADGYRVLYQNDQPVEREGYMTHLWADEALRVLRDHYARHREQPFFLYLPQTAPHFPFQDPAQDTGVLVPADQWSKGTRETYVKMIEDMDQQLGRVLELLDELAWAGDTVVIFTSDHGAQQPGLNAPYAGYKGTLREGGIRAPLIVRWPGRFEAGSLSQQVAVTFDLTASLLSLARAAPAAGQKLDGVDILQHVRDGKPELPRTLFWRGRRDQETWRAVRDGDLKYLSRTDGEQSEQWLFDLKDDPTEQRDLAGARPQDVTRLKLKLSAWEDEVRAPR